MKRLKLSGDKRAITPVLSSLLLMVVAVAAMAIVTTATYVITSNLRETMSERVIMEDLWFSTQDESINIYVRNVGKVAIHVSSVYVNSTPQSFAKPFDLDVGGHRWLNITRNWAPEDLYYVDVVTSRGTHVGDYFKAP